jgi:hypothetical protein
MKNLKKTIVGIILLQLLSFTVNAQDTTSTLERQQAQNNPSQDDNKPGKSKFSMKGYYHTGFENITVGDENDNQFNFGSINPIFMFKQSDKLFFESEFEGEYEDGEFHWGIEYADMSFMVNDYMTFRAGKFLLPFGTFMEKLHPAWVNRLATRPLGFGHDGISPMGDVGAELRGAFYTGPIKINYQAYVVNGPRLKDGSVEEDEAGMLMFGQGSFGDNNNDKAFGGRLGILPFTNSMLEIGFSGLTAKVGDKESVYEDVKANLFAIDLSLVKNLNFIKSVIDIKGQYNYTQVDDANFAVPEDTLGLFYDFNNVSSAYYGQLSIRPALSGNNFIRKLELVGRYSVMQTPEGSLWEKNPTQIAIGLNYWLDWRTVIKFGYQTTDGAGGGHGGGHDEEPVGVVEVSEPSATNMFYVHFAIGF